MIQPSVGLSRWQGDVDWLSFSGRQVLGIGTRVLCVVPRVVAHPGSDLWFSWMLDLSFGAWDLHQIFTVYYWYQFMMICRIFLKLVLAKNFWKKWWPPAEFFFAIVIFQWNRQATNYIKFSRKISNFVKKYHFVQKLWPFEFFSLKFYSPKKIQKAITFEQNDIFWRNLRFVEKIWSSLLPVSFIEKSK